MSAYPQAPARNFLGLAPEQSAFETSQALVLPVPYEATTSYRGGTKSGPQAILDASSQVELYDRELRYEPALRWGVHTLPALAPDLSSPKAAIDATALAVAHLASTGKFLCVLGGEHSISAGVAQGLHSSLGDFLTVQLDAHADLRDSYDETPYSHACAARRIAESGPIVQLGIRSYSLEEDLFIRSCPEQVTTFYADTMHHDPSYLNQLAEQVQGQHVFLTIDIDVLDPSVMPSTGTPEPGGLNWYQTWAIIQTIVKHSTVIAFDCVELSPLPGLHAPDFLAAKLVYKTMSLIMHSR